MHLHPAAPLSALALMTTLFLSSCGAEDEAPSNQSATTSASPSETQTATAGETSASPSETPDESGTDVSVTREGGKFTPNGERIKLDVGETLVFTITADEAGELHVHSTPEQTIAYGVGTTEHEITIDRPGLVEVENHEPAVVVFQLEVR